MQSQKPSNAYKPARLYGFVPANRKLMENAMAREEKKEHPWMTDSQAKRVAVDHLRGGKKK